MSGASLLFAILVAEAQAPAAEGNPYLLEARLLYERLEPAACLKRLEQATHWDNTREEQLELFGGLCAYFVGNEKAAAERFELALRLRPEAKLPPRTSPKIEALFDRVRARVKGPPETAPPSLLPPALPERASLGATELTGSTEATASLRAPPARPLTLAQRLVGPIVFGAAAIIAATVAIVFGAMARDFEGKANGLKYEADRAQWEQYGGSARFYASASNWGSGATGVLALGAGGWLALSFLTEPRTPP